MGFLHWVGSVFSGGVQKVEDLVHLIRSGLAGLWHILTNLGRTVGKAWHRFTNAVEWLLHWLTEVAGRIAHLLRWLYRVVIPRAIRHALATAAHYVHVVAGRIEAWAKGAIAFLRSHLVALIADVRTWAHAAVRWLTQHLADAWNLLARTAHRVWNLLDDPAHLAEWAIGAIVSAFMRWARRNAVSLGRWVVHSAAPAVIDEAPAIEDWLARII